MTEINKMIKNV